MKHNSSIVGFAEGTHVLMADGNWKTIENVKQGDMVMSFNPSKDDSELEPRKVVNTWSGIHRDCIEVHQNDKVTVVAKDQLFFTPGAAWLQGFNAKEVLDYTGNASPIQTRNVRGGKWKIYDITVDKTHAFIANDMRVHNGTLDMLNPATFFGLNFKPKSRTSSPPKQSGQIVTAGRPGLPVSVTTVVNGKVTTVVVNPSPGSSGQISVSTGGSGTIKVKQTMTPGVGATYIDYQPARILPYPSPYQYGDRVLNAVTIRDVITGSILSKGDNYRITTSDFKSWNDQFNDLLNSLNDIKKDRGLRYRNPGRGGALFIHQDPSAINDAIRELKNLQKELKAGRKLSYRVVLGHCTIVDNILSRIDFQCGDGVTIINRLPQPHVHCLEIPVCPAPDNYFSDRIYEDNANYGYYTQIGCTYVFDPPNAPAVTSVKYYKHWDSVSNKYYYDRISSGAFCTTAGGNTQA